VDPYTSGARGLPPPESGVSSGGPDADERELIAAVLRKDRKAAARFVAAHIDAVYAHVRHRLTPRDDLVDDVVQDVFLAALDGLAAFQGQSTLRAWIIGIARHKIEDVYRRLLRAPEVLDPEDGAARDGLSVAPSIEEHLDSARQREKTGRVLAGMPERYGLVLRWRYWEQRSVREIAIAVGATEKSVERTLARARERFRQLWLKDAGGAR
jgi:RNA polymerase sigma-70 factor (ECF subfamily)